MRVFLFATDQMQAVTTDQAGNNLPRPPKEGWAFVRQISDVTKELSAESVGNLKADGFVIIDKRLKR
jgi:hypothetical protein